MAAGRHRIKCEQGTTFRLVATYKDDSGDPVNLTGYSARMQVRRSHASDSTLLDLASTGGSPRITVAGSTGVITVTVPASITAELPAGRFVYDLEIISGGGEVTRIIEGDFVVDPEVTR